MAYTGVRCGSQDLQSYTSPYLHIGSIEQISDYTTAGVGSTCGVVQPSSNNPPNVRPASHSYVVPKLTPFTLTASVNVGDDPNGDTISYSWEEFDLGAASGPDSTPPNAPDSDADGQIRPIFRSFDPKASPSRTFPRIEDILSKKPTLGEALPTRNRTLNFRLTARDGNGGVSFDTVQVQVMAINQVYSYGPFTVTQPQSGVAWQAGNPVQVTWDVANTNLAPINCNRVNILLSTDGGQTFPTVLSERPR